MATNEGVPAPEIIAVPDKSLIDDGHPQLGLDEVVDYRDGIEYRNMTFDSVIPTVPVLPPGHNKDLPPCPDLRKFQSPFRWSRTRKKLITYLSCSVNGVAAYASGSYVSAEEQLVAKWNVSHVVFLLGISVFTYGFGLAPMVLAPLSEINGRRPIFVATGILFAGMQVACALTPTFAGMLISRLLLGIGGCELSSSIRGPWRKSNIIP